MYFTMISIFRLQYKEGGKGIYLYTPLTKMLKIYQHSVGVFVLELSDMCYQLKTVSLYHYSQLCRVNTTKGGTIWSFLKEFSVAILRAC